MLTLLAILALLVLIVLVTWAVIDSPILNGFLLGGWNFLGMLIETLFSLIGQLLNKD